jgi:hypothetical protein
MNPEKSLPIAIALEKSKIDRAISAPVQAETAASASRNVRARGGILAELPPSYGAGQRRRALRRGDPELLAGRA